jgi:hypothetical protein
MKLKNWINGWTVMGRYSAHGRVPLAWPIGHHGLVGPCLGNDARAWGSTVAHSSPVLRWSDGHAVVPASMRMTWVWRRARSWWWNLTEKRDPWRGGFERWCFGSGGRSGYPRRWWKGPAAPEGRGEDEARKNRYKKQLMAVLTEEGNWRWLQN